LVLLQSGRLVGAGLGAGVLGGLLLTRFLQHALFGVTARNPAMFAATAGMLMLLGGIACAWPAWRALRVDPMKVLH
jgi:putative ABC transport system permease protein